MNRDEPATTFFHILGYQEHGEWCALCLEMDLVGLGDTFEEAYENLQGIMQEQFALAKEKEDPGLLLFPAEPKYFRKFAIAMSEALVGKRIDVSDRVKVVPITAIAA